MLTFDKPYIIGETALHHEGDVKFLENLILEASQLGVNAIKVHLLFNLDDYIIPDHPAVEVIKKLIIPKENWSNIFDLVNESVDIIALCNDIESLKWINFIQESVSNLKAIELHSTGLNDIFLLEEASHFKGTVILGVGGSNFEEIKYAIDFLKIRGKDDIFLMHGFQNYPTEYQDINFDRMSLLRDTFKLPIGYADHTDPSDEKNAIISCLPQVMGFNVLEKHFTTHFGNKRIDSQAAVSIDMLRAIINLANEIFSSRGTTPFEFSEAEKKYGNTGPMKKAIVARNKIQKGKIVTIEDISFKRTESSSFIKQMDLPRLLGAKALVDIDQNSIIDYSNVEFKFTINSFDQFFINEK